MSKRVDRFFKLAYKATLSTPKSCRFAVGAVIVMGSRVVSKGFNEPRTHPASPSPSEGRSPRRHIHAEVKAVCCLNEAQKAQLHRCTIYVTRRRAIGNGMGMSKPCPYCEKFLLEHGITNVWYTDNDGNPRYMKLKK